MESSPVSVVGKRLRSLNILLAGVGGQGTLLASDVISLLGMEAGYDVKKSEVHGMAQRGGSVVSHVRWGTRVRSPLIEPGSADVVVAFERLEALRHLQMLAPKGIMLVSDYRIVPMSVTCGGEEYPDEPAEESLYAAAGVRPLYFPARQLAADLGNLRVNNVVLLGALSALLPIGEEQWLAVVERRVPARSVAQNRRAFAAGRSAVSGRL